MPPPSPTKGLRHLALRVSDIAACTRFYTEILGMRIEWQPDADNVYLTSGSDNLALHRDEAELAEPARQRLDHLGFILESPESVDEWFEYMNANGINIAKAPKTHRDGARSFYCMDPEGNVVQLIYHPPLVGAD